MIKILVDSSSDYSIEEIREKDLTFVPIHIRIGEKSYADSVELTRDRFYELLTEGKEFPQTSQPSPQAFLDIFQDVAKRSDQLICILLSSALSGTFQSAALAKAMVNHYEGIYLIDSLSATCTIQIMAEYALRLRDAGMEADKIVHKIEALKSRVKVIAALDTLTYLSKGGRIGKTTAAVGEIARIKPVITITEEGSVGILGKCPGRNKALGCLLKHLEGVLVDPDFPLYTLYSYGTANCLRLEEKLSGIGYQIQKRLQIGATIGAHIGPEAFGLLYVQKV